MILDGQGAIELNCAQFNCSHLAGQGATRSSFGSTYCPLHGQGATEYLVLLAVVLIVALVSVALLGFFPGMASDSQIAQSKIYWQSATPIAIVESGARVASSNSITYTHFTFRNTGVYPVRITGIIGGDGGKATLFRTDDTCGLSGDINFSDFYYLAPGEEKYLSYGSMFGLPCNRRVLSYTGAGSSGYNVRGASSVCQNSTASPGALNYKTFGFEYIEYLDNNQQITKRQIGKDLIIKCRDPS